MAMTTLARRTPFAVFAIAWMATALLAMHLAHSRLMHQRANLSSAAIRLARVRQEHAAVEQQVLQAQLARQLLETAHTRGFDYGAWNERAIHVRQAQMKRGQLNVLLGELANNNSSVVDLDLFDLAVRDPGEGLFTPSRDPGSLVVVSVKGRLLFRT